MGAGERVSEVHVLDFEGDLYGLELVADVRRRLRGDVSFGSQEELAGQISEDMERARAIAGGRDEGQTGPDS